MLPDDRQLDGRERDHGEAPPAEVLLMMESSIAGEQHLNSTVFCGPQQLAVVENIPSHIGDCDDLVVAEQRSQGVV